MGYTLPQAIKEEKKDEEMVGISKSEKRKGWKTESEEEKRERRFRGVWVSCFLFIFCLRKRNEREYCNGRGGVFLFIKIERVSSTLGVCFHLGRERLGYRGPPWSFFLPYMYMYLYVLGFHE